MPKKNVLLSYALNNRAMARNNIVMKNSATTLDGAELTGGGVGPPAGPAVAGLLPPLEGGSALVLVVVTLIANF